MSNITITLPAAVVAGLVKTLEAQVEEQRTKVKADLQNAAKAFNDNDWANLQLALVDANEKVIAVRDLADAIEAALDATGGTPAPAAPVEDTPQPAGDARFS